MSILIILNEILLSLLSKQQMKWSSKLPRTTSPFCNLQDILLIKALIIRKLRNIFYLRAYLHVYCVYNLLDFQVLTSLYQYCNSHRDLKTIP